MEHGRWNAERLLDGWRLRHSQGCHPQDQPVPCPLEGFPDDVKKWDRDAVKEIPALLAKVGLQVCRNKVSMGRL